LKGTDDPKSYKVPTKLPALVYFCKDADRKVVHKEIPRNKVLESLKGGSHLEVDE
jgi:hypothetical protein